MTNIVTTMGDIKGLEEAKKSAVLLKENASEAERTKWLGELRQSDAYLPNLKDKSPYFNRRLLSLTSITLSALTD